MAEEVGVTWGHKPRSVGVSGSWKRQKKFSPESPRRNAAPLPP